MHTVLKSEKSKYEFLQIYLSENVEDDSVDLLLIEEFYFEAEDAFQSPIENLQ